MRSPRWPLCWSRCGDVARSPPIASDRHGGRVEHGDPRCCRTVAGLAGQKPPVEFRPRDSLVPFEQPLGDSMPGEGIEVAEGCFRHTVTEICTPSSEHRVEAPEEISKAMMTCPFGKCPHLFVVPFFRRRWMRNPRKSNPSSRWHTRDFSTERRSPEGLSPQRLRPRARPRAL